MSSRAHRNARSLVRGAGTAIALLLGALATPARAQVAMVYYDFQDNAPLPTVGETSVDMSVAAGGTAVTRAGNTTVTSFVPGAFGFGFGLSSSNWSAATADPGVAATDYYEFAFSSLGLAQLRVTFNDLASSTGPGRVGCLFSTDDGASWSALTTQAASAAFTGSRTFVLGAAADNRTRVMVRLYGYADGRVGFAAGGTYAIDNLRVSALTVSSALDLIDLSAQAYRTRGQNLLLGHAALTLTNTATLVRLNSTFVVGTLTIGAGATFDLNGRELDINGASLVNNGTIAGSTLTAPNSMLVLSATTLSGTGSLGSASAPLAKLYKFGSGSFTITSTAQQYVNTVDLEEGLIVNSGRLTIGNPGAAATVIRRGGSGITAAGAFDAPPVYAIGPGGLSLEYLPGQTIVSGNEIPSTRVVRSIVANVPGTGVFFQGGDVTVTNVTMIAGPFYLSQNPVATPAFRITPGGTLVSAGGNLGGGGPSEGRFIFQGDATVTGPVNFLDLELQGGTVDIDPSANVHGRLVLDGGRFAPGRVPAYSNITLEYHGDYAIADEWTEDGSAGSRPGRVEISEGTLTWNASASSRTTTAVTIAPSGAFVLAGDASAPLRLGSLIVQPDNGFITNGHPIHFVDQGSITGNASLLSFDEVVVDVPGAPSEFPALKIEVPLHIAGPLRLLNGKVFNRKPWLFPPVVDNIIHLGPNAHIEATAGDFTTLGAYAQGGGLIAFDGGGTVSGTVHFSIATVEAGGVVHFGTDSHVGVLRMGGGSVAPGGAAFVSTIEYWTSGSRGPEWSATSGRGYPFKVKVLVGNLLDPVTIDLAGGEPGVTRQVGEGGLVVRGKLTMNGPDPMSAALRVLGGVTIEGALELSARPGGDLSFAGDLDFTASASFATNGRLVTLDGTAQQTITFPTCTACGVIHPMRDSLTVDYLTLANAAGVKLTPAGASKVLSVNRQLKFDAGILDANGNIVRIGSVGSVIRPTANGYVEGTLVKTVGTGPVAKLTFDVGRKRPGPLAQASLFGNTSQAVAPGDDTGYAPIEITLTDVTREGTVAVTTDPSDDPALATSGFDGARIVHRTWTATPEGVEFGAAAIGVGFPSEDIDAAAAPAAFGMRVFGEGAWHNGTLATRTPNSTEAAGFTRLGRVAVGNPQLFVIDAQAGAHGSVAPAGASSVEHGASLMVSVTPDAGSAIVDVLVDGASVGAVANWSFSNVTAGHTLAASFMVGNHAPTLSVPDSVTAQEGAVLSFVASASDPDLPAPALTFSLVTPTPAGVTVGISTGQVQWTPSDNGSFMIRVRVSDGLAASESDVPVRVLNVAPTANITSPAAGALYAVGAPVSLTGGYADPGTGDTHTAQWVVDGQLVPAVVTPSTHTVSGSWATAVPGVYSVRLVVTDDDGGVGQATQVEGLDAMLVVYDPAGGFATGGGWFLSPVGAYLPDTTLSGKASFGFVSKYQRGATVPTGETEFQFKAANLRFQSNTYEWLVVSGARAQFRGSGSINGVAGYKFTLTATDGDLLAAGTPDRMRIRVWSAASGGIVYDNQRGASDTADPVTALGGGSIVIHQPPVANGRGTQSGAAQPVPTVFAVHAPSPNPTRGGALLGVDLPEAADVTASVIDVSGREVERLACGVLAAGRHELRLAAVDRSGRAVPAGMYFVRVTSVRGAGPRQTAVRKLIVQ